MKRIVVILLVLLLMLPVHALAEEITAAEKITEVFPLKLDVNEDGTAEFVISIDGLPEAATMSIKRHEYQHATYTHYLFHDNQDFFQFTTMKTTDNDIMFFAKQLQGSPLTNIELTIEANETSLDHHYLQPVDKETFLGDWNQWQSDNSVDLMPLRPVYVKGDRLHARIGVVDVFTPQGYTVLKREASIPVTRIISDKHTSYQIKLTSGEESFSETWGILSGRPLINWEIPYAGNMAKKIDIDTFRKVSLDGLYDVTPLSYEPASEESYYRNPANITGLHHVFDLPQRQFGGLAKIVLTHLAYASLDNQNDQGFWQTSPKSKWLFTDYQIGYDYFDNRRNADNVTFLLRFNKQFPDPRFELALQQWDDFLYSYIELTSLRTSSEGYLLSDYVDKDMKLVSHTALNHHVAILNYLLESNLYQPKGWKQRYAQRLIQGIEDTRTRWVKPDLDLYYALYRNLQPHHYADYYSLTLEDMLLTQSLLRQNRMNESPGLNSLIVSKQAWIEGQRIAKNGEN